MDEELTCRETKVTIIDEKLVEYLHYILHLY